jgi:uncharacterized cupredoxin-like copper-binding protein
MNGSKEQKGACAMGTGDLQRLLEDQVACSMSRREVLRRAGLLGIVALPILAGCGGTSTSPTATNAPAALASPTPPPPPPTAAAAATTAKATAPPAGTTAASPATSGTAAGASSGTASTVNVEARETADGMFLVADTLSVPAGTVTFQFKNAATNKLSHEVWISPIQDLTALIALKRANKSGVDEKQYLKGAVVGAASIAPGKSESVDLTMTPGFYELDCFARGQNPDGSTFVHFDMGQSTTLAVTGSGGPAAAVATPASTMSVNMVAGEGDFASSWSFVPDTLAVPAGDVTFKVTNNLKESHDFVVYPLGDISAFVAKALSGADPDVSTIKGQELLSDLPAGKSDQKTMKLTPGVWAAACFMVSKNPDGTSFLHRDRGQRFTFSVQ